MTGRHNVARDELNKFKSLLGEYGELDSKDERCNAFLHQALGRLGSAIDLILKDIERINDERSSTQEVGQQN
ncbi:MULTISPECIES: hypothetical protein [unclassified Pseudomonas]|uniref:hypothetical protein n=1 Tax=unclassified Pseudomonas TaxID=196821 RepID=UPI001AE12957|nr:MULTISPECIES: hypothetical protein [unclassified Pseudomonas]HDS1695725.1 hypothetical protein [Pseudomonas putida]MBP2270851.1 hypothetical protein [Pseudomonas sp. BP6]MBP2290179.1 hypothetical protein [Pseudomonas sp. BP7]MBP2290236.1 hypothetical protein [Pseudomonas sp. BP7]HDS1700947.1 hypothetical protein [Pseudomonas putida]